MHAIDLATAIFALGLHQEPHKPELPFFLLELRRKIFWFAYVSDKGFATFFGRPPMINGKFCTCKMPLDLDSSQLGLTGEAFQRTVDSLDDEGWSRNMTVDRTSWLRAFIITSKFRDEVLEISLGTDTSRLNERVQ